MNKQEFAPFYVGQEVEAVVTHEQGPFTKGDKFTVTSIWKGCCGWSLTVGIPTRKFNSECVICGIVTPHKSKEWAFRASRFRAITPAMEAVTFEKITEQHPVSVN